MENLVNFLMNNYLYFVAVAGFLILALIGYLIDTSKSEKMKKMLESKESVAPLDVPVVENISLDDFNNVRLSNVTNNLPPKKDDTVNSEIPTGNVKTNDDNSNLDLPTIKMDK